MPEQPDWRRAQEPRGSRRASRQRRWGSLRGGAGVGIIAASAAVGAAATIAHRAQPGEVLGVCIVVGTVIAALAVRPRAGRLIFPVPVLSYLIAALTAGIVYNRSTSKTELVIGSAQWVANGFLLMALATGLAIVLVTVRWIWQRRVRRGPAVPDRSGSADETPRRSRGARDEYGTTAGRRDLRDPGAWSDPGSPGAPRPPGSQPGQRPPASGGPGQRNAPYPGQRPGQGNGPYPGQRPGQGNGQYPGQRPSQGSGPGTGSGHGQSADQRPGPGYGQYPGQGSASRTGSGSAQSPGPGYGQYPGQGSGQRNGTRSGQGYGQYPEQVLGQGYGQYPGQYPGQDNGQNSGQRNGSDPDERAGQRYGTYPERRNAP